MSGLLINSEWPFIPTITKERGWSLPKQTFVKAQIFQQNLTISLRDQHVEKNMIRFSSQEMMKHTWLNISKTCGTSKIFRDILQEFLIIYLPGQDSANNVNKKCLSWQLIFVFQWLEARQLKPAPLTAFHQYDQGTIKQKRHRNPPLMTSRKSISLCSLTNFLVYLSLIYQQQFWVWSK